MGIFKKLVSWGQKKSPWIIHFNAGACNGCDIEFIDSLTPKYDIERIGILQHGSPRHADILICTGAVTLQTRDRLIQIYEQMASPKYVIAVGTCACTGGIFNGCYCVMGGIDTTIPVDVYLPGCAVRPEAVIDAIDKLLNSNDKDKTKKKAKSDKQKEVSEESNEEKSDEQ
ncbi:MAG TPA: NADH-quinone oxidoreductase subunit B family protein [Clostridiales bacterium]|nr:NADH-quinone oxidoreductase subunit B family protein [Clostridiales bacterium]